MDDDRFFLAIASSDGKNVDMHFGKADRFYIYDVFGDCITPVETREVEPACDRGEHSDEDLETNFKRISDCRHLIVSRIGYGACAVAQRYGVEPHEIPGKISESIEQLITTIKINSLFE